MEDAKKTYNHDIEFIEGLMMAMFNSNTLTDEQRDDLTLMLSDKKYQEDIDREIEEFLKEQRDKEKARLVGEAMYERIMSNPRNRAPRYTPEKHATKRLSLYKRTIFKVAAVLIPIVFLGGAIGLIVMNDNRIDQLAIVTKQSSNEIDKVDTKASTISIEASEGQEEVLLPDGSKIRLDKNAKLEYESDFMLKREVKLTGNAFFTVEKMNGATFEVFYNDMTIRVLGTEFYVNSNELRSEVTLKSGSVQIVATDKNVLLEPNQKFVMNTVDEEFSVMELTEAEMAKIYRGKLEIRNETLQDALRHTAQFFGVEIDMPSAINSKEKVLINFDINDNLEDVLFAIREVTNNAFDYQINDSVVKIKSH